MSEQAIAAESAPAESGDFFSAIEAAFDLSENPVQESPQQEEPAPIVDDRKVEDANEDSVPEIKEGTEAESTLPIDEEVPADEADDGNLSGKAGRRFKQLKTELKQSNTELEQLRNQLQEREQTLKEYQAQNETVDQYKETMEQYEQTLAVTRLESTHAYKVTIQEPMVKIVEAADALANRYGIDSDELIQVLGYSNREQQDDALDNLLQGVKDRDKLAIYALAEQVPVITAKRQQLVDNADAALAELSQLEEQNQKQQYAQQLDQRREAASQVRDKLVSKVPFLRSIEGLDFDSIAKHAGEADFNGMDVHNKVYSKIAGDMLPKLVREFSSLRSELEDALDELESFKKASPKTGGGPSAGTAAQPRVSGSFMDAINAALG